MDHQSLTSTGIRDWCHLSCVELELWEVKAIRAIDSEWLKFNRKKSDV